MTKLSISFCIVDYKCNGVKVNVVSSRPDSRVMTSLFRSLAQLGRRRQISIAIAKHGGKVLSCRSTVREPLNDLWLALQV